VDGQKPVRHGRTNSISAILDSAERLAFEDAEAFGRLVVEILCKLAEFDREAYEFFVGGMIAREMQAAGLLVALEQVKQALASGDVHYAAERVSAIEGWVRRVEYLGSTEKRLEILAGRKAEGRTEGAKSSSGYVM